MKETQGDCAAAVLDSGDQASAPAEYDIREPDLAFNHHIIALPGRGDGCDTGPVLVAQGQVEQQVVDMAHATGGQFLRQLRAHPTQFPYRELC